MSRTVINSFEVLIWCFFLALQCRKRFVFSMNSEKSFVYSMLPHSKNSPNDTVTLRSRGWYFTLLYITSLFGVLYCVMCICSGTGGRLRKAEGRERPNKQHLSAILYFHRAEDWTTEFSLRHDYNDRSAFGIFKLLSALAAVCSV